MKNAIKVVRQGCQQHWAFCVFVILPTAAVGFYLWGFATPQYVSEAHFLVRGKSATPTMGGLGSLLDSHSGASEDTYVVQDYMLSRDAAAMLQKDKSLVNVFNHPYIDEFARFPSIFTRKDFESFYNYYRGHVKAKIDAETGISHLTIRAFSPEDAQNIAKVLLTQGEKLVNEMNARQRQSLLGAATKELAATGRELHDTELELASYRRENSIIDPLKQSTPMVGAAFSIQNSLGLLEAEKAQLERTAPGSPLIKVYAQRIKSLQWQSVRAQEHLTGSNANSLIPKLLTYDELEIRQKLIEKKLTSEMVALETAKQQADRQMLFVTIVAQPNLPDYPAYPRNTLILILTFVTTMGVYLTGKLLIAGAREHALQ